MRQEMVDLKKFGIDASEINKPQIIISAEEIRQYAYCKRVIYFRKVMHFHGFKSYKMERGEQYHEDEIRTKYLEKLAPNLERYYNVYLVDEEIGLLGLLDMFEFDGDEAYPVEFKTGHPSRSTLKNHHVAQLVAYALLIENKYDFLVRKAKMIYVDYDYDIKFYEISIEMKRKILRNIDRIRDMVITERLPNVTKDAGKCQDCEFYPYCRYV